MSGRNQIKQGGNCSCIGGLLITIAIAAAGISILTGILTLTGQMPPSGSILAIIIFALPLFIYLVVAGLNDFVTSSGWRSWFKLGVAGAMVLVVIGLSAAISINLGGCGNRLIPGGNLIGCDFTGQDLSGRDLHGANLTFAVLGRAKLTKTNLEGANLASADLSGADLTDVNLLNSQLDHANLSGTVGLNDDLLAKILGVGTKDLAKTTALHSIQLERRADIQTALAGVCSGQGVNGVRLNNDDQSFHTVMVMSPSSDLADATAKIGWEPMALRFTDLVACLGQQTRVRTDTCDYTGGAVVARFQYEVNVRLMKAATGLLVYSGTVTGNKPACPDSTYMSSSVTGDKVSADDLTNWLGVWVHPLQ